MAEKKEAVKKETVKTTQPDVNAIIDDHVAKAQVALHEFMSFNQEQVDHIVHEMALAALDKHMKLAKLAVEETKRGIYEDKIIKNLYASEYIWHAIKNKMCIRDRYWAGSTLLTIRSALLLQLPKNLLCRKQSK